MTPRSLLIAGAGFVLLAGLLVWLFWPADPLEQYRAEMTDLADRANALEHLELVSLTSQSLKARVKDTGVPLPAIAMQVMKRDEAQGAQYRFIGEVEFVPGERATARFTRQAQTPPEEPVEFTLPFIYEEDAWRVHDRFPDRPVRFRDLPFKP